MGESGTADRRPSGCRPRNGCPHRLCHCFQDLPTTAPVYPCACSVLSCPVQTPLGGICRCVCPLGVSCVCRCMCAHLGGSMASSQMPPLRHSFRVEGIPLLILMAGPGLQLWSCPHWIGREEPRRSCTCPVRREPSAQNRHICGQSMFQVTTDRKTALTTQPDLPTWTQPSPAVHLLWGWVMASLPEPAYLA